MELKKSPKADLENKKSTFLLTGIIISLGLVISLFSWSKSEKSIEQLETITEEVVVDVAEVTIQEEKPPVELPKTQLIMSDLIKIVNDDAKITDDIVIFDESMINNDDLVIKTLGKASGGEEEVADDVPVLSADKMPTFNGKSEAEFKNWCQRNIKYPAIAEENGIQGKVTLSFVVERDGSVSTVKILRGADKSLDDAAVKQVLSSPKWTPGENRGKPVRVTFIVPIEFQLRN